MTSMARRPCHRRNASSGSSPCPDAQTVTVRLRLAAESTSTPSESNRIAAAMTFKANSGMTQM